MIPQNDKINRYQYFEVIDRADGTSAKVHLDDPDCDAEVREVGSVLGLTDDEVWSRLADGEHLTTFGFVRRLTK